MTLCEVAITAPDTRNDSRQQKIVSGLTTLMFYSVFSYFLSRLKSIWTGNWCVRNQNSGGRNYRHYFKCLLKFILEWVKAVVLVIVLREQGMTYRPDLTFNFVTFSYYLCTEKTFTSTIESVVTGLNLEMFEARENLYVAIILKSYTLLCGVVVVGLLGHTKYAVYALISSYFMIYLNVRDLVWNYVKPLQFEKETFASFKTASARELEDWNDICAVCLDRMNKAKVTPCNHLFHPQCLRRCLKTSFQCPLCKRYFPN